LEDIRYPEQLLTVDLLEEEIWTAIKETTRHSCKAKAGIY